MDYVYRSFFEVELDEEEAKRSILITDVPEDISPKDVVIHFQKGINGGGEVVNIDQHGNEHRSSVVITFEDPSIVESTVERQHFIKGKEVTVQPSPVETSIPEVVREMKHCAQTIEEEVKWLFYGKETNVRSSVAEVYKTLKIDNPFQTRRRRFVRKGNVDHVLGKEENHYIETERPSHEAKNQRQDELRRTLETKRQAHQETTQAKYELQMILQTERRTLQATKQRKDELQRTLETERRAHQATKQRKDELQRTLETERRAHQETTQAKFELQRTLETERQEHRATNQRQDELRRTLETERQGHRATNQRKDELQRTLETERQAHLEISQRKEALEGSLEEERQRINELLATQATLQRSVEDYRASTESCDWVLARDEIMMTENLIGIGAWGSVTEGKFRGCEVAVKQIHQLILSDHNRRLFEREIGIASRCRHPCLLQFIGATNDNQSPLFVTELLDSSLRALLHERALNPTEITTIAQDVAKGLNYLHLIRPTPIIHRDISSANVLLWKHNTYWRAKVSDFGTANFVHQSMTVGPGALVYSAPESFTSTQTPKVDVYSFGVLLCEMFVRDFPDVARRNEQIALVSNEFFRRLIRRCLQQDPDNRPSMSEILEELKSYQNLRR